MSGFFTIPEVKNEQVLTYAPGTPERANLRTAIREAKSKEIDIPMIIDGKKIFTQNKVTIHPPHEINHTLGYRNMGDASHVQLAIEAALKAKHAWENMSWQDRASIFLKAADLLSGPYRQKMNAATMLGQSKNVYQSETDAVCELVDFWRFNVKYMTQIYEIQPSSSNGIWNKLDYRPLEGFIVAITPFNFTAIGGNLPTAPAMLGNVVIWKPAETQVYSAAIIMEVLEAAGLPHGVINMITVDGATLGQIAFTHHDFAGLHFTGSTLVFQMLWKTIGDNLGMYTSYPKIVGETGGKDFVLAHPSADAKAVSVALLRGAFEFQGQKCSAASRAYMPASLWPEIEQNLLHDLATITMGSTEDFSNFINAVIDERAFTKIAGYIDFAAGSPDAKIIAGGKYDKSIGYFIEPTIIVTTRYDFKTMVEEIFGPVLTVLVYDDQDFDSIVDTVDQTSPYALTGSIFCQDKNIMEQTSLRLRHAAGNLYKNDKPTGAVVDQQPFGGARASGTNDKAGSVFNLVRWLSPRTIKENFNPPHDYRYPFLAKD